MQITAGVRMTCPQSERPAAKRTSSRHGFSNSETFSGVTRSARIGCNGQAMER